MAKLPEINPPEISVRYPTSAAQTLPSTAGASTFTFDLKRTQGVLAYQFVFNEGTLTGGSAPAWVTSGIIAPLVTHIKIVADNDTIVDVDYPLLAELQFLLTLTKPDGTYLNLEMVDRDYYTGKRMPVTLFPSWIYNQVQCTLTLNSAANVTSGSPTGGTTITVDLTEEDVPRASCKFKPLRVKRLQVSVALPLTGDNDLTSFLAQTGAYKMILLFSTSASGTWGASGTYASPADTNINRVTLLLNDTATVRDDMWTALKKRTQAIFGAPVDSGFAVAIFMSDSEASKLLDVRDTKKITNVDLRVNTAGGSDYLYAMRVIYQ
jgi:hypothetical protein